MDLSTRTLEALDWPVLLARLAWHCRTLAGASAAVQPDLADSPAAVRRRYACVQEVRVLLAKNEQTPVGAVGDVAGVVRRAGAGSVLDGVDLQDIGHTLVALTELRQWLFLRSEAVPLLWAMAGPISVEPELQGLLSSSFESNGDLSATAWPEIGMLRARVRSLKDRIRSTLEDILRSPDFAESLQERYVTERGGRFVIPVKASHRRGLGIIHDRSNSGETVYVEPGVVVELQNELGEAEVELLAEQRRILGVLSRMVGACEAPILRSLDAATAIDLVGARSRLGDELRGCIPTVGEEGVLVLDQGRHPVLSLRGIDVIPNDLRLDSAHPGLVLTGPNTGGKTVALKLLGLAALLARAGIPVPAAEGSRVDFFSPILADIGDLQSVSGDLSTFSGHVMVVKEVLATARPGALVLLDEVAVGTDPAQGAALARAVMEAILSQGARVVVTTHYGELKVLPLTDTRFQVAAVLYEEGRPTYRVQGGLPGSSHALAIAGRLGLATPVIERARGLLDEATRALDEAMERLEEERTLLLTQQEEMRKKLVAAEEKARLLEAKERRLEERLRQVEGEVLSRHRERLRQQEEELRALVAKLQQNPDMKQVNTALETVRATRKAATLDLPEAPMAPPEALKVGEKVQVKNIASLGEILAISGEKAEVRVGALRLWVATGDVRRVSGGQLRKAERKERAFQMDSRPTGPAPKVRTRANTCDLRGQRVEEAMDLVDLFLDQMVRDQQAVAFLLHGHGTGALKEAIRQWLPKSPAVRTYRAAAADEGGDAYTLVELA